MYACGSNSSGQLGTKDKEPNLFEFKNIQCTEFLDQNLLRIIALDQHSIVYSASLIFAWGQNTGQLGLRSSEGIIPTPVLAVEIPQIILLDACNSGLTFYSANKSLNVFYSYKMHFYKTPNLESIRHLAITDADKILKVLVMTDSQQIYIWDEQTQKYTKCDYNICRQFEVTKLIWSGTNIVVLAGDSVFLSSSMSAVSYTEPEDVSEYQEIYSTKKDISQTNSIKVRLRRVNFASNVKNVWCDAAGLNFIFIRASWRRIRN